MTTEEDIIKACINGERKAQKALYDKYAAKMLGVCLRYAKSFEEAEDVLQEAFLKVFSCIGQYRFEGSFEGWIRRVIVNTALNSYRSNLKHNYNSSLEEQHQLSSDNISNDAVGALTTEDLLKTIQSLPAGYRTVFNLYEIEGYKHKEIAEMLNISENTSKTQLLKAKAYIRGLLDKLMKLEQTKYKYDE